MVLGPQGKEKGGQPIKKEGWFGQPSDEKLRSSAVIYFTNVLQNFSIRSRPFSMFAMLVA
jgi:hypothetical protein